MFYCICRYSSLSTATKGIFSIFTTILTNALLKKVFSLYFCPYSDQSFARKGVFSDVRQQDALNNLTFLSLYGSTIHRLLSSTMPISRENIMKLSEKRQTVNSLWDNAVTARTLSTCETGSFSSFQTFLLENNLAPNTDPLQYLFAYVLCLYIALCYKYTY